MEWYNTLAIIVTALAAIFGLTFWSKAKLLVSEIREAFTVLEDAMSDDKLDADELRTIVKEFMDIIKVFFKK